MFVSFSSLLRNAIRILLLFVLLLTIAILQTQLRILRNKFHSKFCLIILSILNKLLLLQYKMSYSLYNDIANVGRFSHPLPIFAVLFFHLSSTNIFPNLFVQVIENIKARDREMYLIFIDHENAYYTVRRVALYKVPEI